MQVDRGHHRRKRASLRWLSPSGKAPWTVMGVEAPCVRRLVGLLAVLASSASSCRATCNADEERPTSTLSATPTTRPALTTALRRGEWVVERWDYRYGGTNLNGGHRQHLRRATAHDERHYELTFELPLTPDKPFPSHYACSFQPPLPPPIPRSDEYLHFDWSGAGFVREIESPPAVRLAPEGAAWPEIVPFLVSLPVVFRTAEHATAKVERISADVVVVRVDYVDPELPPPRWEYRNATATGTLEIDRTSGRPRALALDVEVRDHSHGRDLVRTITPEVERFWATWEYGSGTSPARP